MLWAHILYACEVHACICKMHVYEVYAVVGDIWEIHVWEMHVCKVQLACEYVRYMEILIFEISFVVWDAEPWVGRDVSLSRRIRVPSLSVAIDDHRRQIRSPKPNQFSSHSLEQNRQGTC